MKTDDSYDIRKNVGVIDAECRIVRASVQEVRDLFDALPDDESVAALGNALDEAQGAVHSGSAQRSYVLLIIE